MGNFIRICHEAEPGMTARLGVPDALGRLLRVAAEHGGAKVTLELYDEIPVEATQEIEAARAAALHELAAKNKTVA